MRFPGTAVAAAVTLLAAGAAGAECTTADVSVKLTRVKWVDACTQSACPVLKGAALVTHRCTEPVGVQLRLTGYDASGSPVAVVESWPWSISNRPAGQHPISLDNWLPHDPELKRFTLDVVQVRQW